MVTVLYFASVRQKLGINEEIVPLAEAVALVDLILVLRKRSGPHAEVFSDLKHIRAAINTEFAQWDALVAPNDEVAFFPSVTGGHHV